MTERVVPPAGIPLDVGAVVCNLATMNAISDAMDGIPLSLIHILGIIREDRDKGLMEIGVPVGIVAALIPSTNPTSTVMYKTIISVKAGNSIVISPHPNAKKCILETVEIIKRAAREAGAPEGTVGCIRLTTMEATNELLKNRSIGVILALSLIHI